MMRASFLTCALLVQAAAIAPVQAETPVAPAASARPMAGATQIVAVGGHFSLALPAGWARAEATFGHSAEEKHARGLNLHGPARGEIGLRISVHYYGNAGSQYRSINHYLEVFSKPALGVALEGSEYGAVTVLRVAGRSAKVFERVRNEFVPLSRSIDPDDGAERQGPRVYEHRELMARPVAVRERHVVIPADGGFFALRYTAAQADFGIFLADFETVLASFAPGR